jgi:hypothetical protein
MKVRIKERERKNGSRLSDLLLWVERKLNYITSKEDLTQLLRDAIRLESYVTSCTGKAVESEHAYIHSDTLRTDLITRPNHMYSLTSSHL